MSVRAVLLGLLLLPLNALLLVQMEMGHSVGPYPTTFSLFGNVVLWLALLVALNRLLRRLAPRRALTVPELLTVYVILCIGSAIASVDFLDVLTPMMAHPVRFATAANRWETVIWPHLPPGFVVRDADALKGWYEGHSTLYTAAHLRAWLGPVLLWSAFIFVLLGVMLCIAVLVRRRWIEHERLSFPILVLPLEMTEGGRRFWTDRLLWAGFAVSGGICLLNGISYLYPVVPSIPVKNRDIGPLFINPPWNALGWTPVSMYPFAVGLGYLLPLDLLFSCWFFYLWWKAERIVGALLGLYGSTPRFPYVEEQCTGAYIAVALAALWSGRFYLRSVLQAIRPRPRGALAGASRAEPLSYRIAVAGLVIGIALLVGFFSWAGLPWGWGVAAFALYFLIALACARMRAELGPPAHDLHRASPELLLTNFFGTGAFSARELTVFTYFYWFNRAYRSIPITHQLESFKLAERSHFHPRQFIVPITLATVIGTLAAFWAHLHLGYHYGLSAKMAPHLYYFGWEAFGRLENWLNMPSEADWGASSALVAGLVQALLLQAVRLRWARWPFHPLGLAVSGSYSMGTIWLPLLVSWCAKSLLLRYGGIRAYSRARPFFLGLVLGDFLIGCLWPLYGWVAGVQTYSIQQ